MPTASNVIPTRQLTETLFSASQPGPGLGSIVSPVRKVEGFNAVSLFAVADAAFLVIIEEACESDGPFIQTESFSSASVSGLQRVCDFAFPCGSFMRVSFIPLGVIPSLVSFCVIGIPVS